MIPTLDEFERYLYVQLAQKRASYHRALWRKASQWFSTRPFTKEECSMFLSTLTHLSPSAYNNYLKSLKKLSHLLGHTFLDEFRLKKCESTYIPVLDEEEARRVILRAYALCFRRGLALELFLRTGLRANELRNLQWIDFHEDCIFVKHTKTSKVRTIPLLPDLVEKIAHLRGNHEDFIFATNKGKISRSEFNLFLRRVCKDAHISKHLTAHKLRHSFATLLDVKGITLKTIMELMGHTNMTTTQGYLHTTLGQKKEAVKKVSYGNYQLSYMEAIGEIEKFLRTLTGKEFIVETQKRKNAFVIRVERN